MTNSYFVELPLGLPLINANDREHWTKRANATATIRSITRGQAKGIPRLKQAKIRAIYRTPDNRRRDIGNWFPALKAAIDGLVDASVLRDDSDKYLVSIEMIHERNAVRGGQLVLEITEVNDECL